VTLVTKLLQGRAPTPKLVESSQNAKALWYDTPPIKRI